LSTKTFIFTDAFLVIIVSILALSRRAPRNQIVIDKLKVVWRCLSSNINPKRPALLVLYHLDIRLAFSIKFSPIPVSISTITRFDDQVEVGLWPSKKQPGDQTGHRAEFRRSNHAMMND